MKQVDEVIQRLVSMKEKYHNNSEICDISDQAIHQLLRLNQYIKRDKKIIDSYFNGGGWGKGKDE